MFWPFGCNHPFAFLAALADDSEVESTDADFVNKMMRLRCQRCGAPVTIRWLSFVGTAEAFLARPRPTTVDHHPV